MIHSPSIRRLTLTFIVIALVAGCGSKQATETDSGAAGDEKIILGFLVKQPEELWFQNEWKFAQQCADKYGFELSKIGVRTPPSNGDRLLRAAKRPECGSWIQPLSTTNTISVFCTSWRSRRSPRS